MTFRAAGYLACCGLALAVLAGCGVRPDTEPRPIGVPAGPFQALASPSPATEPSGSAPETLYLVKDGSLTPVVRHLAQPPGPQDVVNDLVTGPTTGEGEQGFGSALVGTNLIGTVTVTAGQAVVELAGPVEGTVRNDEVLAYGQVVCTLTTLPGVTSVTFSYGGQPVKVPRGDLSLSDQPLTKADYAGLIVGK